MSSILRHSLRVLRTRRKNRAGADWPFGVVQNFPKEMMSDIEKTFPCSSYIIKFNLNVDLFGALLASYVYCFEIYIANTAEMMAIIIFQSLRWLASYNPYPSVFEMCNVVYREIKPMTL